MTPLKTRMLTRQQIGAFISSERGVRAFEGVQEDIGNQYEALTTASFLTVSSEPSTGSERTFTPSGDFDATDNGPNSTYVFSLSDTGVASGPYAGLGIGFSVDGKGRITAAAATAFDSDDVPEGGVNLYFTQARARGSVSGGDGLAYDSGTGIFDVGAGNGITANASDIEVDTAVVATLDDIQTLTNKTVDMADNSLSGTKAEFDTACSDGDFAFLDGAIFTGEVRLPNAGPTDIYTAGFRGSPVNEQTGDYTLVLADAGKTIYHDSGSPHTFTIPANASVAFPRGTILLFVNRQGSGTLTIAITTDTMRLAGAGTTGSRSLATSGMAMAVKTNTNEWYITNQGGLT